MTAPDQADPSPVEFALDLAGPWTLAEVIEIEQVSGETLGAVSGRLMAAAAWVLARRVDPTADLDTIAQEIKVTIDVG